LELSELFAEWRNGGVKQSDKYKAVTAISVTVFLRQCAASDSDLFKGWYVIEVSKTVGRQCAASDSAFNTVAVQQKIAKRRSYTKQ
jgi:hypothetical protein